MTAFPHADVFWDALPAARRSSNRAELETRLAEQLADAEACWPDVSVEHPRFMTHWAAQLARASDVGAAIDQLHLSDLYLAFACAEGDTCALRAFGTLLSSVAGAVRSVDGTPSFVDEILQRLRTRVLVPEDGRSPRILDYAGRGSLENWLRAGALRLALNARRDARRGPEPLPDASFWEPAAPTVDRTLELLRGRYASEFGRALREAFGSLEAGERNVLRMHFLEGLSLNQIAATYQVNKSTISRRMAKARETLLERTRAQLERTLALPAAELDSLLGQLGPKLDLSLSSVLAPST
ncbi:MAG TPA: sigma-70 family RNA polymerase sigma factor [Myxococcaceae bacterium]|nr:sigma-70 family RNA polymerase sigma factor [Myxococcaceae bacterium]